MPEILSTDAVTDGKLPTELARPIEALLAGYKLKIARAYATSHAGDELEQEVVALRRAIEITDRSRHAKVLAGANRILQGYRSMPEYAAYAAIDAMRSGAIESVRIGLPPDLSGDRLRAVLDAHEESHARVSPQTITRLQLNVINLRCEEETDEIGSDEIVLGINYVGPRGGSGYSWFRRVDFDKGETKGINQTYNWYPPTGGVRSYHVVYSLFEEDWQNAAEFIARMYDRIKDKLRAGLEGLLGDDIGGVVADAVNALVGWLLGFGQNERLGTFHQTFNLGVGGAPRWSETNSNTLVRDYKFTGDGGRYKLHTTAVLS